MSFIHKFLILIMMIFFHLFADYNLQGCLANLKQKNWWIKNANKPLYRDDYKIALIEHSLVWSFMIVLPFLSIALKEDNQLLMWLLAFSYIINTIIHAIIDNEKANKHRIGLISDQFFHFMQILCTWIIMIAVI